MGERKLISELASPFLHTLSVTERTRTYEVGTKTFSDLQLEAKQAVEVKTKEI
jgi:hypothetical protein